VLSQSFIKKEEAKAWKEKHLVSLFLRKEHRMGIINSKSKVTQNNGIAKRSGYDEKS
jgi:hypothetical protein